MITLGEAKALLIEDIGNPPIYSNTVDEWNGQIKVS